VAVLVLCTINYFDRAVISLCMPVMEKDLHFGPEVIGVILSSFFWGYTLAQIPVGWICDRVRAGTLLASSGILWGVFQIFTGFISSARVLMFLRALLGISEAPMYPAGSKLQSIWLPSTERGRGAALLAAGSDVGIALGGPLVVLFLAWLGGWRGALIAAGVLTIVVVLACYRIMNSDPNTSPRVNQAERDYIRNALVQEYEASQKERLAAGAAAGSSVDYLKNHNFWAMCMGFCCADALYYGLMTWGPLYLSHTQHLNIKSVGGSIFIIYAVAVAGALSGGYFTDKWRLSGVRLNTVMHGGLAIAGAVIAISMYLLRAVTTAYIAIVLLSIAMFFLKWSFCLYWQSPAVLAQRKDVGTIAGTMNFIGNLAGVVTPICVGLIVGATGSYFWVLLMFVGFGLGNCLFPWFVNYEKKIGA
jgi:ACS family D-galactonate transporter-like MFS transporter